MKLCVFQGTFNPIHNAHIKMARYAINTFYFDKVLFIPAYKPPHKDCDDSMALHRLNMVKLALFGDNQFEVSDIEYKNERTSYTYLTICELYKKYDIDGKINFIIGTDAFNNIDSWYESDKLKSLLKFIVFPRTLKTDINVTNCDYEIADMDFYDISSTDIRQKVKNNESLGNLVSKNVERYIYDNGLYK